MGNVRQQSKSVTMNTLTVTSLVVLLFACMIEVDGFGAGLGTSMGNGKRGLENSRLQAASILHKRSGMGLCSQICDSDSSRFGCLRECKRYVRIVKRVLNEV